MFQTGLSSRNVYHWNAMMSPIEARPVTFRNPPYQTITTLTTLTSRPQDIQRMSSRRCAKSSFRRTRVPAEHVLQQLARLAPERPDHPDAREGLADAAVDLLDVFARHAIDRPHAPREDEAHRPSRPG